MARAWFTLSCFLLLAPLASAQPSPEAFQTLVNTLADPSMQSRDAGTEGLAKARDLITERLRDAHLQPGFDFGDYLSYTQPFEIGLGVEARRQGLELQTAAGKFALEPGEGGDFNALGFSGNGAFEGAPIFLGYGVASAQHEYDSFSGLTERSLAGKVAIFYRYEPHDEQGRSLWSGPGKGPWTGAAAMPAKAREAQRRGAAGVLIVDPPSLEANALRSTAGTATGMPMDIPVFHLRLSAFQKVLAAAGRDPRITPGIYEREANRQAIPPDLLDGVTLRGEAVVQRRRATIENVAGLLPGQGTLADEWVIVGAHYDHIRPDDETPGVHPGADDNASGTAALILVADTLSQRWREDPPANRRGVLVVAFAGEERGLLGSAHLVAHPGNLPAPLAQVVAMVNLDMVGRLRDDRLTIFGAGTSDAWRPLLEAANQPVGLTLAVSPLRSVGVSDHTSFTLQRVPSVHLFTGLHPDYHGPNDTADRINAPGGARVAAFAAELVARLATEPERPPWRK